MRISHYVDYRRRPIHSIKCLLLSLVSQCELTHSLVILLLVVLLLTQNWQQPHHTRKTILSANENFDCSFIL